MFGRGLGFGGNVPIVLTAFVIWAIFCDIKIASRLKDERGYNRFETLAGSYVDICVLLTIGLVIAWFLGVEVIQFWIYWVMNILLTFLYVGFVKLILQNIIRTTYSSYDKSNKKDKKAMRRVGFRRFGILPKYFVFILFFHNFTVTFNDGIFENKIAIVGVLLFGAMVSKSCAKINLAVRDMYRRDWRQDDDNNRYRRPIDERRRDREREEDYRRRGDYYRENDRYNYDERRDFYDDDYRQ